MGDTPAGDTVLFETGEGPALPFEVERAENDGHGHGSGGSGEGEDVSGG